jgi:hypothetical protein
MTVIAKKTGRATMLVPATTTGKERYRNYRHRFPNTRDFDHDRECEREPRSRMPSLGKEDCRDVQGVRDYGKESDVPRDALPIRDGAGSPSPPAQVANLLVVQARTVLVSRRSI